MKETIENVISIFNGKINSDDNVFGYFYATNEESKANSSPFDLIVKKDKFYFAISKNGLYLVAERDDKYSGTDYFVKSGFYLWETIKLLEIEKKGKRPYLKLQFSDGRDLLVFIDIIDEDTKNILISKECQPDSNDEEFIKNKKKVDKSKNISLIISIIGLIVFFILIRGC